jgi:TonB-dependent starch-binding outer membrane protein SusC
MKISTILILAACLQVSARSFSQNVTLSVKDAPLDKVLNEIKKQTGYEFFYNQELLQKSKRVNMEIKDMPIEYALKECFRDQPLTFSIFKNNVVVKEKTVAFQPTASSPPPIDIHGRVTDSAGMPMTGASVTIKGTKKGVVTDANGFFTLKGIDNNATLLISFTGYETKSIRLEGKSDILVQLKHEASSLQEVVVNKGYYSTTQKLNTGDVAKVSGEDIQKQPVTDPILALEGRVPGLYIQETSGVPGANSTIRLRGQNSIASGNNPLYIVDGVPYSSNSLTSNFIGGGILGYPENQNYGGGASPFNYLDPNNIESIEVLKDADATAIYGSRGANGVILITTKKGKGGRTQFDVNIYSGSGKVTKTLDLLNTKQYLEMRHEAFLNDGLTPGPTDYDLNGTWDTTRYTDWQKVLIGNSSQFTNINANLSGGNTNTQFMVGGTYSDQGTVYPGSYGDEKASGHFNLTHISSDHRLHAQISSTYLVDNSNLPSYDFTYVIGLAPDAPALYDGNGNLNWQTVNGTATWSNPLANTVSSAKAVTHNFISNLNVGYNILPGLELKGNFGYSNTLMDQIILFPASFNAPPNNNDPGSRTNENAITSSQTWLVEPQINYRKKLGQGQLDILIGTTFQETSGNSIAEISSGFSSDALIADPLAGQNKNLAGYSNSVYRYNAFFGRVNYNWDEKFLLNITGRRDGSSRFGPGRQFGNFGAIAAGWIFSKEKFIQNGQSFLSFGKLRVSYGLTGNDQIGDYQFLSLYNPYPFTYAGISGLSPTGHSNPNFGWETVRKAEAALELGFLGDRIFLTASYYINRTSNQLIGYQLPLLTGFNNVQANLPAVIQNSGAEFVVNSVNIKAKNFKWTTSINLTIPDSKLISFPGLATSSYAYNYSIGQSLFIKETYHSTGVDPQTGVFTFATKNANGQPSAPQDLVITKPITQKYYGGMANSFTYKGLSLDIFFQFVKQLGISDRQYFYYNDPGYFNENMPTYVLDRWQKPGDVTNVGKFSTQYAADPPGNIPQSDYIISNASFIRLKNVSLSYTFPQSLQKEAHLHNARIYIQCQNLLTITKYAGLDPASPSGGVVLPALRIITGGIQLTL